MGTWAGVGHELLVVVTKAVQPKVLHLSPECSRRRVRRRVVALLGERGTLQSQMLLALPAFLRPADTVGPHLVVLPPLFLLGALTRLLRWDAIQVCVLCLAQTLAEIVPGRFRQKLAETAPEFDDFGRPLS